MLNRSLCCHSLCCHPVYNDVGFVKAHESAASRKRGQGRHLLAFISTLDAASGSPIMERGTKRSAV
jgi:hypothetical protein